MQLPGANQLPRLLPLLPVPSAAGRTVLRDPPPHVCHLHLPRLPHRGRVIRVAAGRQRHRCRQESTGRQTVGGRWLIRCQQTNSPWAAPLGPQITPAAEFECPPKSPLLCLLCLLCPLCLLCCRPHLNMVSRWWAPSGIHTATFVSEALSSTPATCQGSYPPLLHTMLLPVRTSRPPMARGRESGREVTPHSRWQYSSMPLCSGGGSSSSSGFSGRSAWEAQLGWAQGGLGGRCQPRHKGTQLPATRPVQQPIWSACLPARPSVCLPSCPPACPS